MYISILQAQYMGDFKILFNFNDKVSRLVDFKPFLQKSKHLTVKNYLQKESLFQNFKIEYGDIFVGADGGNSKVRGAIFGKTIFSPIQVKEIVGVSYNKNLAQKYPSIFTKFQAMLHKY